MNCILKHGLLGIAFVASAAILSPADVNAQFPMPDLTKSAPAVDAPQAKSDTRGKSNDVVRVSKPKLVDSVPSSSESAQNKPTVAELRQARAQYRSQQRIERMERNLWWGHEPLRPRWNSIPMMSSRYGDRGSVLVRYYVYP